MRDTAAMPLCIEALPAGASSKRFHDWPSYQ
jgi:hypothetical protein